MATRPTIKSVVVPSASLATPTLAKTQTVSAQSGSIAFDRTLGAGHVAERPHAAYRVGSTKAAKAKVAKRK